MQRRPTIKDVAREAEVSTVTVSRVVNGSPQVQPETRARVEAAMLRLGYSPNLAARSMRTSLTQTVGFLVPDLTSYPNAAVAQAAERRLAEEGYAVLLASSDYRAERERRVLEVLRTRQVDGIVLYVCDEQDPALRAAVAKLDVPLVVLDRDLPVEADCVLSEHVGAMGEAVRYLTLLGHRRMALLLTDLRIRPVRERRRGFEAAIEAAGLAQDEQTVLLVSPAGAGAMPAALALLDQPDGADRDHRRGQPLPARGGAGGACRRQARARGPVAGRDRRRGHRDRGLARDHLHPARLRRDRPDGGGADAAPAGRAPAGAAAGGAAVPRGAQRLLRGTAESKVTAASVRNFIGSPSSSSDPPDVAAGAASERSNSCEGAKHRGASPQHRRPTAWSVLHGNMPAIGPQSRPSGDPRPAMPST